MSSKIPRFHAVTSVVDEETVDLHDGRNAYKGTATE